ncbi:uncharacterized protein EV422DRAFT_563906 [Fimicolochytrium jonesii]|uniref:uncharacterized protein n=1 Tax=Fimicolochytrium jonesii TaxID=1396493 RepID=UPI0022FE0CEC|nr:uncharacterized protein EV422DRAFT_563906 [Fimicolochytrium jonesii]KAI8826103.1 hypothetical protein EV422DRAFT_563906 [Fimicolochytrium jonesii]
MAKKERVAQKAASEAEKKSKAAQQKEEQESAKWSDGAKGNKKKELEEQKKQELLEKKKEREAMLAAEEKELNAIAAKGAALKGSAKKAAQRTERHEAFAADARADIPEFAASGIDAALDLLDLTTGVGTAPKSSDKMERHPEKRMKSAWAAFEEREMPLLKEEQPNLRLTQYKQLLQKRWKKSPENPMASGPISQFTPRILPPNSFSEERELVESRREEALAKLRVK